MEPSRYNVAKLDGKQLDCFVAMATGDADMKASVFHGNTPAFSTDWAYGGPIIEREKITLALWPAKGFTWAGQVWGHAEPQQGDTPLIAAMRAFVASVFGETVEA